MFEGAGAIRADGFVPLVVIEPGGNNVDTMRMIVVLGVPEKEMPQFMHAEGGDYNQSLVFGNAATFAEKDWRVGQEGEEPDHCGPLIGTASVVGGEVQRFRMFHEQNRTLASLSGPPLFLEQYEG
jgi:hypothetical protein